MKTRIREYREKLGLSQERLGELCGVTRQTIIALEQGRYNPSLSLATKITKALKKRYIEEIFSI
jgi:putative transcriptional regulator